VDIGMFLFLVVCNRLPLSLKRLSWKVTERIRNFDPRSWFLLGIATFNKLLPVDI